MVGLPASGKTKRAREVERDAGALRLTPDEWMLPLLGVLEDTRRDVLEGRFIWLARQALSLGTSVVLDFGVWSRAERSALRALAAEAGAGCELIYMEIDEETQRARRDLRESVDPRSTVPLSDDQLDTFAGRFEAPAEDELAGGTLDPPPRGFATWAAWTSARWPTSLQD
jgi:predicted kinase